MRPVSKLLTCVGLVMVGIAFVALDQPPTPQKFGVVEGSSVPNMMPLRGGLYLYVYDDEKKVWNRAREETLRTAACDHIRTLTLTTPE